MIEYISQPWPWYFSGPLITLIMFLLLWSGGYFGVSSNLRSICAIGGAGKKVAFFDFDWKKQIWNLVFILGALIGGYIATNFLSNSEPLQINQKTIADLAEINIPFQGGLMPEALFSWESLLTLKGFIIIVVGGFLVGFGTRWAGGHLRTCNKWLVKSSITFSNCSSWVFYWWLSHDTFYISNPF